MSSSDAVPETLDQGSNGVARRVGSLAGAIAPKLARHAESGNLAAASGVVSLVRAGRTFLRGDRKRGLLRALAGLFWVGVALAQRRSGGGPPGGGSPGRAGTDVSEVADTSPDVEGAVEPGGHETDHATGEDVVDTTDADIDEADTAPEVDESAEVAADIADADVDQRDVATDGTDVEDAAEADDDAAGGAEAEPTDSETESEREPGTENETRSSGETDADAEGSDERVETTSGE